MKRYTKVRLTAEELRSLYYYHKEIASDTHFACRTEHTAETIEKQTKRANKFKSILKREFKVKL